MIQLHSTLRILPNFFHNYRIMIYKPNVNYNNAMVNYCNNIFFWEFYIKMVSKKINLGILNFYS